MTPHIGAHFKSDLVSQPCDVLTSDGSPPDMAITASVFENVPSPGPQSMMGAAWSGCAYRMAPEADIAVEGPAVTHEVAQEYVM